MNDPKLEDELPKIDEISEARSMQTVDITVPESRTTLRFDQIVWAAWWLGTILIVLSWINVVSNTVGWIGFAAALASTFSSVVLESIGDCQNSALYFARAHVKSNDIFSIRPVCYLAA